MPISWNVCPKHQDVQFFVITIQQEPLVLWNWHTHTYLKKLNTRWSARIWGNFPPWTTHAKTNQTTRLCFPFYCWHTNNTSVVVYARDMVSPLPKTKDQNRLCSSTLCSVAREFTKDFYSQVLGVQIKILLSPQYTCSVTKTLIRTWLPDVVRAIVSPVLAKKSTAQGECFPSRWDGRGQISVSIWLWTFTSLLGPARDSKSQNTMFNTFQKSSSTLSLTCRWETQAQEKRSAPEPELCLLTQDARWVHRPPIALPLPSGHGLHWGMSSLPHKKSCISNSPARSNLPTVHGQHLESHVLRLNMETVSKYLIIRSIAPPPRPPPKKEYCICWWFSISWVIFKKT